MRRNACGAPVGRVVFAHVEQRDALAGFVRNSASAVAHGGSPFRWRTGPAARRRSALRGVRRVNRAYAIAVTAAAQAADAAARFTRGTIRIGSSAPAIALEAVAIRVRRTRPAGGRGWLIAPVVLLRVDETRASLGGTRTGYVARIADGLADRRAIGIGGAAATIALDAIMIQARRAAPHRRGARAKCVVARLDRASVGGATRRIAYLARRGRSVGAIHVDDPATAVARAVAVCRCGARPVRRDCAVRVVARRDRRRADPVRAGSRRRAALATRNAWVGAIDIERAAPAIADPVAIRAPRASPPTGYCSARRHVTPADVARAGVVTAAAVAFADFALRELLGGAVDIGRAAAAIALAVPVSEIVATPCSGRSACPTVRAHGCAVALAAAPVRGAVGACVRQARRAVAPTVHQVRRAVVNGDRIVIATCDQSHHRYGNRRNGEPPPRAGIAPLRKSATHTTLDTTRGRRVRPPPHPTGARACRRGSFRFVR